MFFIASRNGLRPHGLTAAQNASLAINRSKVGADYQFRPHAAGAQLGACEIQIIALLELVIGELISRSHSDAIRCAVVADDVDSRDLSLFAAIFRIVRHGQRLERSAQNRAVAFIKPLRRSADFAFLGGRPPRHPTETFACCRSAPCSFGTCMDCRSLALPRCVSPVPETRKRDGSWHIDGCEQTPIGRPDIPPRSRVSRESFPANVINPTPFDGCLHECIESTS